ncbi:MAG: rhomboid family intramembrane serine protease [Gemmatimonadaceae bacterium]|nr:rhomboid family intramembrane serine protease [Gemmatimonadaceae bacterium]
MAASSVVTTSRQVTRSLKRQAVTLASATTAGWGAFGANVALGGALLKFGIVPRTTDGLIGILVAPFLHANLDHLVANTVPFLLFGWLVMLRDRRHFAVVTLLAMLGSGLLSWTLGAPNSIHIGASGVVFGYFGFLLLAGWYARSAGSIAISLLVGVLWGGTVLGVLPGTPGISWQGHLGGFIGGVLAARRYRTAR